MEENGRKRENNHEEDSQSDGGELQFEECGDAEIRPENRVRSSRDEDDWRFTTEIPNVKRGYVRDETERRHADEEGVHRSYNRIPFA
jgi:hypothetical protein